MQTCSRAKHALRDTPAGSRWREKTEGTQVDQPSHLGPFVLSVPPPMVITETKPINDQSTLRLGNDRSHLYEIHLSEIDISCLPTT